jgi:hypothetical protein
MVLQGLKSRIYDRLKKFDGRWVAELPAVLWSLRMTPCRATSFTPFFMVYGTEAILPTDLEYGSPREKAYSKQGSDTAMEDALDQLEKSTRRHSTSISKIPTGVMTLPSPLHQGTRLQRWRPRATTGSEHEGPPQAITTMGRPMHRDRGAPSWHIQATDCRWPSLHQCLEHQTTTLLLTLVPPDVKNAI